MASSTDARSRVPPRQSAKLRQHDARESQVLPFVRTRLSDLQRAGLADALRQIASGLKEFTQSNRRDADIVSGAALLACSLETGRHVGAFLAGDIALVSPSYEAVLRDPEWQGLCKTPAGARGWLLATCGPSLRSGSLDDRAGTRNARDYPARAWLPLSDTTAKLICAAQECLPSKLELYRERVKRDGMRQSDGHEAGLNELRAVRSVMRPFAKWVAHHHGIKLGAHLLKKVASDLPYRLANADGGDAALARILTGRLRRETQATSHYTTITRKQAAALYVDVIRSQDPQASFKSCLYPELPDPEQPLGATQPLAERTAEEILEAYKSPPVPRCDAGIDRLMHFHNVLTLRVWLMTSLAIGARTKSHTLINPETILPGNLVLVNDKQAKRDRQTVPENLPEQDGDAVGTIPTTRVIALPDHVAEQITAYGAHIDWLSGYFEPGSKAWEALESWREQERAQPRWEPLLWIGRGKDGSFVRQSKLSARGENGKLLAEVQRIRGNIWRKYMRSKLLGALPSEIIDAHFGHWQEGQGPWWRGAALDPVETWCRVREAISAILPAEEWEVIEFPRPDKRADPIRQRDTQVSGKGDAQSKPSDAASYPPPAPLVSLFDHEGFDRAQIAFDLERLHLRLVEGLPQSVEPEVFPGFLLLSAILWSGLINPATWDPWLAAVHDARLQGCKPGASIVFDFYPDPKAAFCVTQTLYHDPVTARLCDGWRVRQGEEAVPATVHLRTFFLTLFPEEKVSWLLAQLRDSLELRARLRLPAILVDYASGRHPSAPIKTSQSLEASVTFQKSSPYPNRPRRSKLAGGGALSAAMHAIIRRENEFYDNDIVPNRYDLHKCVRKGLVEAFQCRLDQPDWDSEPVTLDQLVGRLLYEMAAAPGWRKGTRLYRGAQIPPETVINYLRLSAKLFDAPLPWDERASLSCHLVANSPLHKSLGVPNAKGFVLDRAATFAALANFVTSWLQSLPHGSEEARSSFKKLLLNALKVFAVGRDTEEPLGDGGQHAADNGSTGRREDPRAEVTYRSYPLVTAEQFEVALRDMPAAAERCADEPSDCPRLVDIGRISTILMFRAGVRPLELSALMLDDLSIRCNDRGEVDFAELLITANEQLSRKTRLSRRVVPLDCLLEPQELALLRDWHRLRIIETGARFSGALLFDLAPSVKPRSSRGARLKASWILASIASALMEAEGGHNLPEPRKPKGRVPSRDQQARDYCHRLRHTAATCILASMLLPGDAGLPPDLAIKGLVPELVNLDRRRRLSKRLLGPGRSGRAIAHAVARILGHDDLTTLRATYLHLMDFSLGMACIRPAVQPALAREAMNRLDAFAGLPSRNWTRAYTRKLASGHHLRVIGDEENRPVALQLPQYRRAKRGRTQSKANDRAVVDCGYLGPRAGSGFNSACSMSLKPSLVLNSTPAPQDVADLVIRATKSGLSADEICQRFGIDAAKVLRLRRNWAELTSQKSLFRKQVIVGGDRRGKRKVARVFSGIDDPKWNSLASMPVQSAKHELSSAFRKYSDFLSNFSGTGVTGRSSRTAKVKFARTARVFFSRRDPYDGLIKLKYEQGKEIERYVSPLVIAAQEQGHLQAEDDGLSLSILLRADKQQSWENQSTGDGIGKRGGRGPGARANRIWVRSEPAGSKWAAYALMLRIIDAYDDMRPFTHSMQYHWASIRGLVSYLALADRNKDPSLPSWIGSRLYGRLERAAISPDDTFKRSCGFVGQGPGGAGYLFRLVGVNGFIVAGKVVSDEQEGRDPVRHLSCRSWRPQSHSSTKPYRISYAGGEIAIHREADASMIIRMRGPECSRKIASLFAGIATPKSGDDNNDLVIEVPANFAEPAEARLFAETGAAVRWG